MEAINVFTFLFGFWLGTLLNPRRHIIHGPDSNDVKRHIFYNEETRQYFKLSPEITFCPLV